MNDYITPISGTPDTIKEGLICDLVDGQLVPVCKLRRETFWNEEYQYVFEPIWETIDLLKKKNHTVSINGLDLDLRKGKYYRVNVEPQFLVSRTPSSTRADLSKLLKVRQMTHYDRMEYLIRSKEKSCLDNLKLVSTDTVKY